MKVTLSMLLSIFSIVFISHMVQMKGEPTLVWEGVEVCFISHMVQMKDILMSLNETAVVGFISHMVQMKDHQNQNY